MNYDAFQQKAENLRRHCETKVLTYDKKRNQLVSGSNCNANKWLSENMLAMEMERPKLL